MTEPSEELRAAYRSALAAYLDAGSEHQLEAAYAVGRQALAAGIPLLSFVNLHREAVASLQTEEARGLGPVDTTATYQFLAEALATFEMTQRGYSEAQERARWEREQSLMLQRSMLPPALPDVAGIDLAVRYLAGEPGSHAGGDWYDVIILDDGHVALVMGDMSGHGLSAAAAMGQLRMAVLAYAIAGYEPAGVVEQVDELVQRLGPATSPPWSTWSSTPAATVSPSSTPATLPRCSSPPTAPPASCARATPAWWACSPRYGPGRSRRSTWPPAASCCCTPTGSSSRWSARARTESSASSTPPRASPGAQTSCATTCSPSSRPRAPRTTSASSPPP
jgi:hypothetical protein